MKANTCLVVDVWEGQLEIDEAVLKANGVAGMGIRLNDMNGGHHMDTGFLKQWDEAKNFVRFPYFVYNPWVDGAANFAWLSAHIPVEAKSFAVDIEVAKSGYSPATYAGEVVKFLTLCTPRWKTIIYTGQWFLPNLKSWPNTDYWWAQYPDPPTYFGGVKTWEELKLRLDRLDKPFNVNLVPGTLKLWQFSGDYLTLPGTIRPVDVDLFFGTVQDLANYFGSGQVVVVPPKPGLFSFGQANYFPRPAGRPLTLEMSRTPRLADKLTRLNWLTLKPVLSKLNPSNTSAVGLISSPNWGPTTGIEGDFINWIGTLWPGRNLVKIEEVVAGAPAAPDFWGRVQGVPLANAASLSAFDNPEVVHKAYNYNAINGWTELASPVYIPILDGSWWVDMSKLVAIDSLLPKTVRIKASPWLNTRSAPTADAAVNGHKLFGENVSIDKVQIGKGGIWGRVSNTLPAAAEMWLALRNTGTNWTDWII